MDLNLSRITIILFSENHLIVFWDSAISVSTSNLTDFANDDNVLSYVKLMTRYYHQQNYVQTFF